MEGCLFTQTKFICAVRARGGFFDLKVPRDHAKAGSPFFELFSSTVVYISVVALTSCCQYGCWC